MRLWQPLWKEKHVKNTRDDVTLMVMIVKVKVNHLQMIMKKKKNQIMMKVEAQMMSARVVIKMVIRKIEKEPEKEMEIEIMRLIQQ